MTSTQSVEERTVNSANYSVQCCALTEGSDGSACSPHPQGSWGVLERFNGEFLLQMSLKGEKLFKVEKDAVGILGMA